MQAFFRSFSLKGVFTAFLLTLLGGLFPLKAQLPEPGVRSIKIGNSLREISQYDQAEYYLRRGLDRIKGKNDYWEAAAYEALGLLYQDLGDNLSAERYFQQAYALYGKLGMQLSARVVKTKIDELGEQEEIVAGIEIGSKGVKASVLSVKPNSDGTFSYKNLYAHSINTDIIEGSERAIIETASAVRTFFHDTIVGKYGVSEELVFVVASSGVRQELGKAGLMEHAIRVVDSILNVSGKTVAVLDECQEAMLVTKGTLAPRYRFSTSLLDIGSGNTKGGFFIQETKAFECLGYQYGTKTLTDRIRKYAEEEGIEFAEAARRLEPQIRSEIEAEFNRKPGMRDPGRSEVCLVGGVVWAMVSYLRPEAVDLNFVDLKPSHFETFKRMAIENYEVLTNPDLSRLDEESYKRANRDASNARNRVFDQENIISGAILLNCIVAEYNRSGGEKRFVFGRSGYIGWISGYAITEFAKRYEQLDETR